MVGWTVRISLYLNVNNFLKDNCYNPFKLILKYNIKIILSYSKFLLCQADTSFLWIMNCIFFF